MMQRLVRIRVGPWFAGFFIFYFLFSMFFRAPGAEDQHWSLKPITQPLPPAAAGKRWPRNPIDNFIYEKLSKNKLAPSPEAAPPILIRRLYFDLIGLPPAPEEVRDFINDRSPYAYERVVDRLLASPQYGERWAQHWLDVVRFAESHGFEMNQPRPNAWRYRDYVIKAFNDDKPYDRFVVEQLAGDVFGEDSATGFLVAGPWDQVKSPDPVLTAAQRADELHDMVSVTGSAFLGLTVGCARCHNHKFDPIPQVDYYAIKACLAGVQHGERKLRSFDIEARERQAGEYQKQLVKIEDKLTELEPLASIGRVLLFEPEVSFGSKTIKVLKPALHVNYPEGVARGERDFPGDVDHLPTSSRSYLAWSNAANTDVFTCAPGVDGRFRLRLSWGCRADTHTEDARFLIDRDGDLSTTNDQIEIARVDQRNFADGTAIGDKQKLWSGFYEAGAWDLFVSNKIVLRGGTNSAIVSSGVIALAEEFGSETALLNQPSPASSLAKAMDGKKENGELRYSKHSFLRAPVSARRNVDRFAPIATRYLRFSIMRTTDAEPCIDELEVYDISGTNVALTSFGTRARASSVFPNSDIHRLEHLNDGNYGNSHSWISNERGKGWVELEFPSEVTISRVIWGRDREQKYSDRLALDYRIKVASDTNHWTLVASSQDRVPYSGGRTSLVEVSVSSPSDPDGRAARDLLAERAKLESRVKELTDFPMAYAGTMTNNPEPVNRLQRGDPMQKREIVGPAALSAISLAFNVNDSNISPSSPLEKRRYLTEDQQRRLALALWIANPTNPLPARVMVNRLWQHHFGEGLVSTPSDFGKKGALPSHAELLDWLASELVSPSFRAGSEAGASAWGIKHIHRLIVTSATYRQSSIPRPKAIALDAATRFLWRFPPQRLEAEQLRDAILSVSGKVNLRPGGPGFSVFEPNDNYVRVYIPKKDFGPAEWRRMIYMTKIRMQQDSTFGAFDCPDGGQVAPKRMRSTTPLQALNMMNSAFMLQQAGFFAERLEREGGKNGEAQVRRAFQLIYSRDPDGREVKAGKSFIVANGLPAFCRVLFNSNEFVFVE